MRIVVACLFALAGCATSAPNRWEDFGVDSSVVIRADTIPDETALALIRARVPAAGAPQLAWHERDSAAAWFKLETPIRGRTSGFSLFRKASNDVWEIELLELALDRVRLADDVDVVDAERLIHWARTTPPQRGSDVDKVERAPDGTFTVFMSFDGRDERGEGCICSEDFHVEIQPDGSVHQHESVDHGCVLY